MPPRKKTVNILPLRRSTRYQARGSTAESLSATDVVHSELLNKKNEKNRNGCETAEEKRDEGCDERNPVENVIDLIHPKIDKKDTTFSPVEENHSDALVPKKKKRAVISLPFQVEEHAPESSFVHRRRATHNAVSYADTSSTNRSATKDAINAPGTKSGKGRGRPRGQNQDQGQGASTTHTPAARSSLKDGLLSDPNSLLGQITLELLFDQSIFKEFTIRERAELVALLPDCDQVFPDTEQSTDHPQSIAMNRTSTRICESGLAIPDDKVGEDSALKSREAIPNRFDQLANNNNDIDPNIVNDDTKSVIPSRSMEGRTVSSEEIATTLPDPGAKLPTCNIARTRTPVGLVSNVFDNQTFREAIISWQLDLVNGRRTPQYLQQQDAKRMRASRREAKRKRIRLIKAGEIAASDVKEGEESSDSASEVDDGVWKDEMFETFWGEKRELTAKNHRLAGDAATVNLKTMCQYNLIQEHDQLIYKRTIRGKAFREETMTIVSTKNQALTVRLGDGTLLSDITTPGLLQAKILEHSGLKEMKIPNGNAFKYITIIRGGEDLGRLFDMRRDFFVNCHA